MLSAVKSRFHHRQEMSATVQVGFDPRPIIAHVSFSEHLYQYAIHPVNNQYSISSNLNYFTKFSQLT